VFCSLLLTHGSLISQTKNDAANKFQQLSVLFAPWCLRNFGCAASCVVYFWQTFLLSLHSSVAQFCASFLGFVEWRLIDFFNFWTFDKNIIFMEFMFCGYSPIGKIIPDTFVYRLFASALPDLLLRFGKSACSISLEIRGFASLRVLKSATGFNCTSVVQLNFKVLTHK
jgi:hypothetical protein